MPILSLSERADDVSVSVSVFQAGLQASFGTFLIGSFLGILLYGLSAHQVYRYIRSFPTDGAYIRLLVILVIVLETLHAAASMHTCFHYFVLNFDNPQGLRRATWSLDALPVLQGLLTVVSQIFFVRRVSLIGPRQRIMAKIVAVVLVGELGFSTAATVLSFTKKDPVRTVNVLNAAALAIASLADTTLTIALLQAFRASRIKGPRAHEPLIDTIQLYVINSGIATGVFNFLAFIFLITLPIGSLLYVAMGIIASRLYANSLLAVLNSRELHGMEFFISASFSSVTLQGAEFADKSALWNVPKAGRPTRSAGSEGGDRPQFTNPWGTATETTDMDAEDIKKERENFWSMSL